MTIYQSLRKFLIANGVDGSTAQIVASKIQRKAQRSGGVAMEELVIVHEGFHKVPLNNFETIKMQRLVRQTSVQPTEKEPNRSGFKVKPIDTRAKPICYLKYKLNRCFVKSWSTSGDADDRPLPPAIIRQLAHHIASS